MDQPTDPGEYLSLKLQRLDLLLHREILRLRTTYQLSLDEFRGLYISDEQVNRLINQTLGYQGDTSAAEELTQQAEGLLAANPKGEEHLRWRRLVAEFTLSPTEQDILLLAVAPEIDLKYETLYAYLNNDVTRKWPTRDLALRVFATGAGQKVDVRRCLGPEATLFSSGLLQLMSSTPERPSWLACGFSVSPSVLDYLSGLVVRPSLAAPASPFFKDVQARMAAPQAPEQHFSDRLLAVEQRIAGVVWDDVPISSAERAAVRRIANFALGDQAFPLVVFTGRNGVGQKLAAEAICRELDITLERIDLTELSASTESFAKLLQKVLLQQRLNNTGLYLERPEALFDQQGHPLPDAKPLIRSLAKSRRPIFITGESNTRLQELLAGERALAVHFGTPDYAMRLQLWEKALAPSFVLTPGQINAAVTAAVDEQTLTADPTVSVAGAQPITPLLSSASLFAAARAQSDQSLGNLAVKVRLIHTWEDLILPRLTLERIKGIAAAIKHRHVVYSDWGFEQRIASGLGLKALFAGPSGTGKTMAAGVIAIELGLDLYKIDLSAIVSKYIGETEKNLDQIFRASESSNAILFFDEADALFGKRSEVKDAHDRYSNIEVAYLLQKIEEYEGVVILASNLSKNIDEAFSRRMHYVVEFPLPDDRHRELLWRGMFPPLVPMGKDVDFQFLAKQFAITGGDIRNVALDAAFMAAQDGQLLTMKQLIKAMARQMMKHGRVPSPADFKQYHGMIAQGE
jgi:hypothetical protein